MIPDNYLRMTVNNVYNNQRQNILVNLRKLVILKSYRTTLNFKAFM